MKINLSPKDVIQLSMAIKRSCLDTDKIDGLKDMVKNYTPTKELNEYDENMLKEYVRSVWMLELTPFAEWEKKVFRALPNEALMRFPNKDGAMKLYLTMLNNIALGLLSLKAMGCLIVDAEPNIKEGEEALNDYLKERYDSSVYYVGEIVKKYSLILVENEEER